MVDRSIYVNWMNHANTILAVICFLAVIYILMYKTSCCCSCLVAKSWSVTLWSVACQAPLSMRFPRQEHRSGLPFPSPRDFPKPGIKPTPPALQVNSLPLCHWEDYALILHYLLSAAHFLPDNNVKLADAVAVYLL